MYGTFYIGKYESAFTGIRVTLGLIIKEGVVRGVCLSDVLS